MEYLLAIVVRGDRRTQHRTCLAHRDLPLGDKRPRTEAGQSRGHMGHLLHRRWALSSALVGREVLPKPVSQPAHWPLSQMCCSTSPRAGTWLCITRAASSKSGCMRDPACSSLRTWRCSSKGSWMTPPHLSLERKGWQPSLQGEGTWTCGEGLSLPRFKGP